MTRCRRAAVVVVAACGCGNDVGVAVPDAVPVATTCTATFTGDFDETDRPVGCASLVPEAMARTSLVVSFSAAVPAGTVSVAIDLGESPGLGVYSSETVATWKAQSGDRFTGGVCEYAAGSTAVPPGSFKLTLAALDMSAGIAHGTLAVTSYVLALPQTSCGDANTELMTVEF